ncbi:MAG: DNA cytosine methyltransferase [Methanobrevibacter sp.]|nr:DNA cytosine methyltransferase [Methanobrevibacter sp.]
MNRKIQTIDLFAGCGGLLDGFLQEGHYNSLACVEWEQAPCLTLANRLQTRWNHSEANNEVIRFDIQRTDELLNGFNDSEYGNHIGLNKLIGKKKVDVIIGGPPCQAYSLAGRIRDINGMRDDYRNYLFESYLRVVQYFQPKFFIFENVVGMLSAAPDGTPIVDKIKQAFNDAGYAVIDNFKEALFDVADFGIPQHRNRVIILGVNKNYFDSSVITTIIEDFYKNKMPSHFRKQKTVAEAIGDLPKLYPLDDKISVNGRKYSHSPITSEGVLNHSPRFHSKRDQQIFQLLASDIERKEYKYTKIEALKKLYTEVTGKTSNIHKFYVLRKDEPSNTIPAHLYKDGLRHIHPDSTQARSITVREAARLQTFADDFEFLGSTMAQYKMIGNAVPSEFARIIASSLYSIIIKYC